MRSTMQDVPLSLARLMQYGTTVHADATVVTATAEGTRSRTYGEVGRRAARLAHVLRGLGVTGDQRVGTFMWNNVEHLEAYLAVPSMGAVLHTVNIRLFPEQVTYVVNHAEDSVVIVDASLVTPFAALLPTFETVTHVLVAGPESGSVDLTPLEASGKTVLRYEEALAGAPDAFGWPEIDERDAAATCYTSGTTGSPKGVVYSHRSAYLHSMAMAMGDNAGIGPSDRVLPIVPMFHANAWGLPYAAVLVGASLVMPDRWLQAEPLVRLIEETRPTLTGGVPTIFNDLLGWVDEHPADLTSVRLALCGGSAVPLALQQALWERHGVRVQQAWGMTETSPVATSGKPPVGVDEEEAWRYRAGQGRVLGGVEARIVGDDGQPLPHDGEAVGELEVRGPWITGAYYRDADPAKFHDGWLRTGDVGTIDPRGYVTLTDRAKDVIKSGGEWISSVDLENALMGHPDVIEAAVVGIPDEKWQERPLATVVVRAGATVTPADLREHLAGSVARWQLPDAWTFIEAVPRTSVGKFDKRTLRKAYADGELEVLRPQ
ncbi:long-chain fatty acid--CoA ligase [Mumia zhuanghuii]|uniref:Long-chain fatty acid--CoA ligase n=1 Tax=Mumia zhuanghuii TaxID=2585211 RepID=A0A5C4MST6_9ACTN|nr:long-chain fatty acid--CoA ligase [Mumia zhuanghuii]TNC33343.1 long-chain fatty acid--CoA ligase [Mumia zhuanghuii]TNC48921.1 long-chain fatty acid--CoA ligase [Mumia zhuanghuii]